MFMAANSVTKPVPKSQLAVEIQILTTLKPLIQKAEAEATSYPKAPLKSPNPKATPRLKSTQIPKQTQKLKPTQRTKPIQGHNEATDKANPKQI